MDPTWRQRYGLRPTLRHLAILVAGSALLFSLAAPALRGGSALFASFLLPLWLPVLAALVLLFDRPGPIKYWLAGILGLSFLPALVLWIDAVAAVLGGDRGVLASRGLSEESGAGALAFLNLLGALAAYRVFRRLPRRCPGCGRRSSLPVGRIRWCASCGVRVGARA